MSILASGFFSTEYISLDISGSRQELTVTHLSNHTCLFPGWYEDNWFETNLDREGIDCTVEQMREAAEGHLTTEALMWNQNSNQTTISGMTSEDFR